MRRKSFTLIELIITIVVIAVLVTLVIPLYENVVEDAKTTACETNIKALTLAISIYAMEHDQLPGALSELPPDCIKRAFVTLLQQKDAWKMRLAYAIVDWQKRREEKGFAYAQGGVPATTHFLRDVISRGDFKMVTCPNDKRSPSARPSGSYAMNASLAGKSWKRIADTEVIVADCNAPLLTDLRDVAPRHRHFKYPFLADVFAVATIRRESEGSVRIVVSNPELPAARRTITAYDRRGRSIAITPIGPCPNPSPSPSPSEEAE